jgi:hypothetical protein
MKQKLPGWLEEILAQPTASVPDAGRAVGIGGKNQSYDAVKRGEMPAMRWGRTLRVSTAWIRRQLQIDDELTPEVLDRVEELIKLVQEKEARTKAPEHA